MTTNQPKCPNRCDAARAEKHSKVIYASTRFTARRATTVTLAGASIVRLKFKAGSRRAEQPRDALRLSLKTLPFIRLKGGDGTRTSFWKDVPTGKGRDDFKRGQKYAALTIAAIAADKCASWDLEKIIEAIVSDAASRRAKGGIYSRTLSPAVDGFIHELSRQLCATITGDER
jgi:hypothetical protein